MAFSPDLEVPTSVLLLDSFQLHSNTRCSLGPIRGLAWWLHLFVTDKK